MEVRGEEGEGGGNGQVSEQVSKLVIASVSESVS